MHNETEPREFVPKFIKAGHLEKYWPTNTKPNDWTLRSAIDDIVSKGLIREAVVPLCFQVIILRLHFICACIVLLVVLLVRLSTTNISSLTQSRRSLH